MQHYIYLYILVIYTNTLLCAVNFESPKIFDRTDGIYRNITKRLQAGASENIRPAFGVQISILSFTYTFLFFNATILIPQCIYNDIHGISSLLYFFII